MHRTPCITEDCFMGKPLFRYRCLPVSFIKFHFNTVCLTECVQLPGQPEPVRGRSAGGGGGAAGGRGGLPGPRRRLCRHHPGLRPPAQAGGLPGGHGGRGREGVLPCAVHPGHGLRSAGVLIPHLKGERYAP